MSPHRPRKRFGQHFLADASVGDRMLDAIAPQPGDVFAEIGPGPGALTQLLAGRCSHLHVIELDRDLAARLRARYDGDAQVSVHEADALDFDFAALGDALRVAGNLPYNISTPLLFRLLEQRASITDMHFMLQKEVVDRMSAEPGSRRYGRLGIMLGCCFEIEALFDVPPTAFAPPPKVMSTVARLRPLDPEAYRIENMQQLSRVVATAFSQRRKTLRNALRGLTSAADLEHLGIDPSLRPENLAIADWVLLANALPKETDTTSRTR